MNDIRIVCCEACGGEGHTERSWDDAPIHCMWCDGTGGEIITVEPVTLDDLMED